MAQILIIEDEPDLAAVIAGALGHAGHVTRIASDGHTGLLAALIHRPDLVVVDPILTGKDGLTISRALRTGTRTSGIPVITFAAKAAGSDTAALTGLIRKVTTVLAEGGIIGGHDLAIDRMARQVTYRGVPVRMTPTEFRLLTTMVAAPGRSFSRLELRELALGSNSVVSLRTIDAHVKGLRIKLGAAGALIEAVPWIGYQFRGG